MLDKLLIQFDFKATCREKNNHNCEKKEISMILLLQCNFVAGAHHCCVRLKVELDRDNRDNQILYQKYTKMFHGYFDGTCAPMFASISTAYPCLVPND